MEEIEIIRRCQNGHLEEFAGLFDLYHKQIYNFIYYRTQHRESAEDILSTTFLKALENIKTFRGDRGVFGAWLYRIARNTIIDHYRKSRPTEDIELAFDLASDTNIPRDLEHKERFEYTQKLLEHLSAQQRDIVIMRMWDGLSHREIAEVLGLTEGNVKVIFSRSLQKLQQHVTLATLLLLLLKP